jgi:cysteinyl-tRNA synthetase
MALTLYNTLTHRQDPFDPLVPGEVAMYCCGVTVYDYCHLGHARSYIVWDTLRRYLLWLGYRVRYVQNFTDIDDKILRRARQEGSSMEAVSQRFTDAYFEDMHRLNILEADAYPRATHTLNGIQRLIHELEQTGHAYAAHGDVYFSVRRFAGYGKLSGRNLDDLQAGASGRVDEEESRKQDPFDFALWKSAKPGEPAWPSDWGPGRPGWHIECSAMVQEAFDAAQPKQPRAASIDIHMGGADLIFPHHENEIAQSEAATGHPLANYWLHNGMVNVGGEKMSKSLGNFTTIRQLLDEGGVDPMVLRLFVLQAHYRKPVDFTDEALRACTNGWQTLREGLLFGNQFGPLLGWQGERDLDPSLVARFNAAMDDDLSTPVALAILFELAKELRRQANLITHQGSSDADPGQLQQHWITLVQLAQVLGLEASPAEPTATQEGISPADIEALIAQRRAARQAKNFAESDRIRDELAGQGITLIDQKGGETTWVQQ